MDDVDQHDDHRHVWCITQMVPFASCRCGLIALTFDVWRELDPDAYVQLVDPDGHQRLFMDVAGL